VADTWNHRIQKFDSNGNFIAKWGSLGSGDGEFDSPCGVAVDTQGFVYVADEDNHRIQKFVKAVSTIYLPLIVKNY
jgi:DNA-binding beta-propeller fold protein YncE